MCQSLCTLPYHGALCREDLVGAAVQVLQQEHGIPRDQLWLQTKFTPIGGQDPASVPYDVDAELETQVQHGCTNALHCTHNSTHTRQCMQHSTLDPEAHTRRSTCSIHGSTCSTAQDTAVQHSTAHTEAQQNTAQHRTTTPQHTQHGVAQLTGTLAGATVHRSISAESRHRHDRLASAALTSRWEGIAHYEGESH